jgi:hypothetical protein
MKYYPIRLESSPAPLLEYHISQAQRQEVKEYSTTRKSVI